MIEGDKIVVTDGVVFLKHSGEVTLKSVSRHLAQFEVKMKEKPKMVVPKKIGGYVHLAERLAKIPSGGVRAEYHYYKDETGAYLVGVWRGYKAKKFHLGSLKDVNSILRRTLEGLPPKGEQFYKRELYHMKTLPRKLKHGQILKAVLDVLEMEGYIKIVKVINNTKEVYERTEKVIEESG
jgi:hypothetical protein